MVRKKRARKTARRAKRARISSSKYSNNFKLVLHNLFLFIALSFVSWIFFKLVTNDILDNLFQVMAMVFGFIAVGLFIALLVLIISKAIKKK
ncbi:Uncharacterised protein [uncultured archaeon]|nr:Uncharacterised protein [uncultured archaeon]